jgi:ribosomal protein L1
LTFENAAVDAGVASAPAEYVVNWSRFDNTREVVTPIADTSAATASFAAPADLPSAVGTYIRVAIAAKGGPESWAEPAHAYFRRDVSGWTLVGFERVPGGNPPGMKGARQQTN